MKSKYVKYSLNIDGAICTMYTRVNVVRRIDVLDQKLGGWIYGKQKDRWAKFYDRWQEPLSYRIGLKPTEWILTLVGFEWIRKPICWFFGHNPIPDQCNIPAHDFCSRCNKSTPNQYGR